MSRIQVIDNTNLPTMRVEASVAVVHVALCDADAAVHLSGIALLIVLEKPLIDLGQVENASEITMRGSWYPIVAQHAVVASFLQGVHHLL